MQWRGLVGNKKGVSGVLGVEAAPGGLRSPHPSLGSWKTQKKKQTTINMQAATCESRWGAGGVMKVTPYGHVPIDGRAAALDCQKLPPPSPGSKKRPKRLK